MHDWEMQPIEAPPHSSDAEQAILCGILHFPDLINTAIGMLQPEHFYHTVHREIFRAILACFEKQAPIEPVALTEALKVLGTLDAAGGSAYVWDLMLGGNLSASVINPESLRYWTKVLIDLARRRELVKVCYEIQESALNPSDETYLEQADNLLYHLSEAYPKVERTPKTNPLNDAIASLEQEKSAVNGLTGLSTGFTSLDKATHGFQPYQLITVSARPGGGKSAFALNVAQHVVMKERRPVLYISLEMTSSELMRRLIKAMAGTDYSMDKMRQAAIALQSYEGDFLLEDAAGQTLEAIQGKILKAKKQRPDLGLIVVDHIGLIASDPKAKSQNRAYEIQAITSRFKTLAKTVQTPILQLAQMNRQVDARQDKKPILSDLRDSGSIEMDSDIVIFTHIERSEDRRPTGEASLTIAKQRDGVQAEIPLLFVPHLTQFREKTVSFP